MFYEFHGYSIRHKIVKGLQKSPKGGDRCLRETGKPRRCVHVVEEIQWGRAEEGNVISSDDFINVVIYAYAMLL